MKKKNKEIMNRLYPSNKSMSKEDWKKFVVDKDLSTIPADEELTAELLLECMIESFGDLSDVALEDRPDTKELSAEEIHERLVENLKDI